MELTALERDTGVVANLYDDVGLRQTPRPKGHWYRSGGPRRCTEGQLIASLQLQVGVMVRMPTRECRMITKIVDDRVYVEGIRNFINVYSISLE